MRAPIESCVYWKSFEDRSKSQEKNEQDVSMEKHRIGIVGGAGFVGFSLAKHLSSAFDVKVLDVKKPVRKIDGLTFKPCDIRKFAEVVRALADVDLVIHTAIVQIPLINENKRLAYEVNVLGTANICKAVEECPRVKGMILSGTWHTIGEKELSGVVDEEFGFRPDKVEDRARLYVLSKMAQEAIVRFYSEMSDKSYAVIRMGTVLGVDMPEMTAAKIFISRGLRGESITPYKSSMYRPMLYVDIDDVCAAYDKFIGRIINNEFKKDDSTSQRIVNVYYPRAITIVELAEIVRDTIIKYRGAKVEPRIEIVDQGKPLLFSEEDRDRIKVDVSRAKRLLGLEKPTSPSESIEKIIKSLLYGNGVSFGK